MMLQDIVSDNCTISNAVMISRQISSGNFQSIYMLGKNVFRVTSYFNETTSLVDLLFSVANEKMFEKSYHTRYNKGDD